MYRIVVVLLGWTFVACGGSVDPVSQVVEPARGPEVENTALPPPPAPDAGSWVKLSGDCLDDVAAVLPPKPARCEGIPASYTCTWNTPSGNVDVEVVDGQATVTGRNMADGGAELCRSVYAR